MQFNQYRRGLPPNVFRTPKSFWTRASEGLKVQIFNSSVLTTRVDVSAGCCGHTVVGCGCGGDVAGRVGEVQRPAVQGDVEGTESI